MVKVKVEESRYETKGADPRLNKVVDLGPKHNGTS